MLQLYICASFSPESEVGVKSWVFTEVFHHIPVDNPVAFITEKGSLIKEISEAHWRFHSGAVVSIGGSYRFEEFYVLCFQGSPS